METMTKFLTNDIQLLERINNLRGEDSTIIKDILKEQNEKIEGKEAKEKRVSALNDEISDLEKEEMSLKDQMDKFITDFKGFSRETYSTLLDKLNVQFDPKGIVAMIEEKAPKQIDAVVKTLQEKKEELNNLEKAIEDDISKLQEIEERLSDAKKTQGTLNDVLKEILDGNKNITVQQITDLFSALGFTANEINMIGSILMFSSKFAEYEELHKINPTSQSKEIDALMEKADASNDKKNDSKKVADSEEKINTESNEIIDSEIESFSRTKEIKPIVQNNSDDVIEQLGIDVNGLTIEEINLIKSTDPIVITSNLRILDELNINKNNEIYVNALCDKELAEKIAMLEKFNKKSQDLRYAISTIVSHSAEELKEYIAMIEEKGLNVSNLSLEVLNNPDNFISNVNNLNETTHPDGIEIEKHSASMAVIDKELYKTNIDVSTDYGVDWEKSNGKIAMEGLMQTTKELVDKMDKYIEAGEEDVLSIGAELLSRNADDILSRISVIKAYSSDYKTKDKYKPVLISSDFEKMFGMDTSTAQQVSVEETNNNIKNIINNDECVDTIIASQDRPDYYKPIVDEDALNTYSSLAKMVESISDECTAVSYTIAGTIFSAMKFKRNILCLLNAQITATNEEMIFAALATNSNKEYEELVKVSELLGFNVAIGGR